jgi:hypothetical protein
MFSLELSNLINLNENQKTWTFTLKSITNMFDIFQTLLLFQVTLNLLKKHAKQISKIIQIILL